VRAIEQPDRRGAPPTSTASEPAGR